MFNGPVWSQDGLLLLEHHGTYPILLDDDGRWQSIELVECFEPEQDSRALYQYPSTYGLSIHARVRKNIGGKKVVLPLRSATYVTWEPHSIPISTRAKAERLASLVRTMNLPERGENFWEVLEANHFTEGDYAYVRTGHFGIAELLHDCAVLYGHAIAFAAHQSVLTITIYRDSLATLDLYPSGSPMQMWKPHQVPASGWIFLRCGLPIRVEKE